MTVILNYLILNINILDNKHDLRKVEISILFDNKHDLS